MKQTTRILYFPLELLLRILALFPLWFLYGCSYLLYLLVYYVVRYRRKVVQGNMQRAFPEKNKQELRTLEKRFFRFFCDYIVETIKLLSISDKQMRKRLHITNPELANHYLAEDKFILLLLGHYGNWEWVPSIALWIPDTIHQKGMEKGQIYRPLKNEWFNHFFLSLRGRFGTRCISKQETLREMIRIKNSGKPGMVGFMADQTPSRNNIHYWTQFLNQETPVYTGVERIGRKIEAVVLYLDIKVLGRGRYEGTYRLLTENASQEPEFALTDRYIRLFEETVLRDPAYWLWSHKRWKYKRKQAE